MFIFLWEILMVKLKINFLILKEGEVILFENIRFFKEETEMMMSFQKISITW